MGSEPVYRSVLNVKALVGTFNQEKALVASRGLLHDCEIFVNLRLKLYYGTNPLAACRYPTIEWRSFERSGARVYLRAIFLQHKSNVARMLQVIVCEKISWGFKRRRCDVRWLLVQNMIYPH